jgi:hypothetical protein
MILVGRPAGKAGRCQFCRKERTEGALFSNAKLDSEARHREVQRGGAKALPVLQKTSAPQVGSFFNAKLDSEARHCEVQRGGAKALPVLQKRAHRRWARFLM